MFINKNDGKYNLCGERVREFRKALPVKVSQRALADRLCNLGLSISKQAISRIEEGTRFVTDIELYYLAKALECTVEDLLGIERP